MVKNAVFQFVFILQTVDDGSPVQHWVFWWPGLVSTSCPSLPSHPSASNSPAAWPPCPPCPSSTCSSDTCPRDQTSPGWWSAPWCTSPDPAEDWPTMDQSETRRILTNHKPSVAAGLGELCWRGLSLWVRTSCHSTWLCRFLNISYFNRNRN